MPKQRRSSRSNRQAGHSSSTKGTSSKSRQPTQAVSLSSPVSTDVRSTGSRPLTTDDIPAIVQQIAATVQPNAPLILYHLPRQRLQTRLPVPPHRYQAPKNLLQPLWLMP